jgi:predicted NBD/HSP70 family sugar kinase
MTKTWIVGVDLGGTKVEACLMDEQRVIQSRHRTHSEASKGLDRVVDNIFKVMDEAAGGREYAAVGMGTPGTYVPKLDQLFGVPHTPVYETPGFMDKVRSRLGVPLLIDNDANCLALAEYFASCAERYRYVLAVIIGTGMGYGLILDGKLYRGAAGGAGEIGHATIQYQGRACECGRHGCAEAYLSGSSLTRRYREAAGETLDVQAIYERYVSGDAAAKALFEESCEIMGEVFANAINAFDLEAIILGGGVSNLPIWYEKVPAFMKRGLFGPPRAPIPILKAELGDSAGVAGAAYLALRAIGRMSF